MRIVPSNLKIFEGESSQLKCQLFTNDNDATTSFQGEWTRDNEQHLPTNFRSNQNVLRIENARQEDSGTYTCTAFARHDTIAESVSIQVMPREAAEETHSADDHYGPDVTIRVVEPTQTSFNWGTRVTVECFSNKPSDLIWTKASGGNDRSVCFSLSPLN